MTKKKYLEELRDELSFLDKKDVEEIISDIENFIIEEKNNKKKIKYILESLGTPQQVAGNYKMETPEKESIKDITKKLFKIKSKSFEPNNCMSMHAVVPCIIYLIQSTCAIILPQYVNEHWGSLGVGTPGIIGTLLATFSLLFLLMH